MHVLIAYSPPYFLISVSFEYVRIDQSINIFWSSLSNAIVMSNGTTSLHEVRNSDDFLDAFAKKKWNMKVILFIDEFDLLYNATEEIRNDCLKIFRGIKNTPDGSAIFSIVAIGTFSIRYLNSTDL